MKEVIEKMYQFYVEGQAAVREMLAQMIQLGAFTQEQFDTVKKDSPSEENANDFVDFLLATFHVHIPEPEDCQEGSFGLTCECKWDPEHGVGVWFENWRPTRVGFAETGFPF